MAQRDIQITGSHPDTPQDPDNWRDVNYLVRNVSDPQNPVILRRATCDLRDGIELDMRRLVSLLTRIAIDLDQTGTRVGVNQTLDTLMEVVRPNDIKEN